MSDNLVYTIGCIWMVFFYLVAWLPVGYINYRSEKKLEAIEERIIQIRRGYEQ